MAFHIRPFVPEDIPVVTEWMLSEEWVVNISLVTMTYNLNSKGCFLAVSDNGEAIGCIMTVTFADIICYVGALIVRSDWRKRGVGKALLKQTMHSIDDRNLCLAAIKHAIPFYQGMGFNHLSVSISEYAGPVIKEKLNRKVSQYFEIEEFCESQFERICKYDEKIHVFCRKELIKQWIDRSKCLVAVSDSGMIVGYGCIQPITKGHWCIGPVFADDDDIARTLWHDLMVKVPDDQKMDFIIVKDNKVAMEIVKEHSLTKCIDATVMYTKSVMEFPLLHKVYARTYWINSLT